MKLNELVRNLDTWISNEERTVLAKIKDLTVLESFEEHDQHVIDGLVRKSLLIKIHGPGIHYIYPNV